MNRIIFTIFIDIDKDDLDPQPPHIGDTEDKNLKAKREFLENYDWLTSRQQTYAQNIGAEYKIFLADDKWENFKTEYLEKYPVLTMYNIVNFYKIHIMYQLKKQYDEILYLDLDVVPVGTENFFEHWNLENGVAILTNRAIVDRSREEVKRREKNFLKSGKNHSIRSPTAKYWNTKAMIFEFGSYADDPNVYNTGIVGINKHWLDKLKYFDNFDETIQIMTELKNEDPSMWPKYIQDMFGWDNETLWGLFMHIYDIPMQRLTNTWHYFIDQKMYIPPSVKLIHVINKDFKAVREWCETNNL